MSDQLSRLGLKTTDPWVRFGKTKWFKRPEADDPQLERAFLSLCVSTSGAYKSHLRLMDAWLNGRELTDELLAEYLSFRFTQGVTLGHLNNIVSAARFRAKALDRPIPGGREVGYVMAALGKRGGRRGRGQAVSMTIADVNRIIERTAKVGTLHALRDAAVIAVGFYLGLRRAELHNLQVEDLTLDRGNQGLLRITKSKADPMGKNPKVRPLAPLAVERVLAWLTAAGITEGPVFRRLGHLNGDGLAKVYPKACSLVTINKLIKRRATAAGLQGITSHSLRRSFAQDLTLRGFSIQQVAHAGRWGTETMVVNYTRDERATRSILAEAYGVRAAPESDPAPKRLGKPEMIVEVMVKEIEESKPPGTVEVMVKEYGG